MEESQEESKSRSSFPNSQTRMVIAQSFETKTVESQSIELLMIVELIDV